MKLNGFEPLLPSKLLGPGASVTVGGGPPTAAHQVDHLLELLPVFPSSVPVRGLLYSATTHSVWSSAGST